MSVTPGIGLYYAEHPKVYSEIHEWYAEKMDRFRRLEVGMIGAGAAFILLPIALELHHVAGNPFIHLFNTASIGITYVIFGVAIGGWRRATRSRRLPFGVAALTAGVSIAAIVGVEMTVSTPFPSITETESTWDFVTTLAVSPHVWLGWYTAWLVVYDRAATRRQRALPIAGVAAVPLTLAVYGIMITREATANGAGAGMEYVAAILLGFLSVVAFGFSYGYAHTYYYFKLRDMGPSDDPSV